MRNGLARSPSRRKSGGADVIPAFFLYGEPLQPPDERLIHVETIAARSTLHNWNIRSHRHRDLHQILLIQRGKVAAALDDRRLSLQSPALVVVPSGTVHAFTFRPRTAGWVLSFAPGLIPELANPGSAIAELLERPAAQRLIRRSMSETDLESLGEMLLREFTRSAPGRQTALRGMLAAVLANILRLTYQALGSDAGGMASERELVARFRRLVEARYRTHMGIRQYADDLRVTESKLRRACLAVAGRKPVELLHVRLLVEAERQLRYTTMPISQVAYHLGFDDPAYFSRFFARRANLSPRDFRAREAAAGELTR